MTFVVSIFSVSPIVSACFIQVPPSGTAAGAELTVSVLIVCAGFSSKWFVKVEMSESREPMHFLDHLLKHGRQIWVQAISLKVANVHI